MPTTITARTIIGSPVRRLATMAHLKAVRTRSPTLRPLVLGVVAQPPADAAGAAGKRRGGRLQRREAFGALGTGMGHRYTTQWMKP